MAQSDNNWYLLTRPKLYLEAWAFGVKLYDYSVLRGRGLGMKVLAQCHNRSIVRTRYSKRSTLCVPDCVFWAALLSGY